jgi:hypothetical protein
VPHGCSGIKGQKADRDHEQQWFAGLSMFLGRKEKAKGSWMIADPLVELPAAPTTGIRRFNAYLQSERRRIVAQVRREVLKNRDFFAVRDSAQRCDDLLTTTVDNDDWAGL